MSTKTSPATATPGLNGFALAPWNIMADLGRQQIAMTTQWASAMASGFDAMRKMQQEMASRASTSTVTSKDSRLYQGLLPVFDLQSMTQWWQQTAVSALQAQMAILGYGNRAASPGKPEE